MIKPDTKSRFLREFNITRSLSDIPGIIEVYDFDHDTYSYTMRPCQETLEDYILNRNSNESEKKSMIVGILSIMAQVHQREIVHRDISPLNILFCDGHLMLSDFGLGKDLEMFHSHRTIYTNAVGHLQYCAPEQLMQLSEGDKKSDVYSLGRIISFIMNKYPKDNNHFLRRICEKATNDNPSYRFTDASEMLNEVNSTIKYYENNQVDKIAREKISDKVFDVSVENFIYGLNGKKLCDELVKNQYFIDALLNFVQSDTERSLEVIKNIADSFEDYCGKNFASYDIFSKFSYELILDDNFSFTTKEISARILYTIAYDVNRFSSQRLIQQLVEHGIEPSLENLLLRNP